MSLPLVGLSQQAPFSPRPYLGAGVSILTVKPFRLGNQLTSPVGPALTAGVQLRPRLAVQASAGLSWRKEATTSSYPAFGATRTAYASDERATTLTLPVLLRYTLPTPLPRLGVDALAGATLQRTSTTLTYAVTDYTPAGQTSAQRTSDFAYNQVSISLGPALRYRLQPGAELVVSAPLNYITARNYADNLRDRLFIQVLAGAHYTFR